MTSKLGAATRGVGTGDPDVHFAQLVTGRKTKYLAQLCAYSPKVCAAPDVNLPCVSIVPGRRQPTSSLISVVRVATSYNRYFPMEPATPAPDI